MIHPMLQPKAAWAEDRALLRSNPSADPGAKTGAGARRSPAPLPFYLLRDWHQSDKPSRQDPATLPVNQHRTSGSPSRTYTPRAVPESSIREAARAGLQRTFEKVDQYAAAHGVTPEEAEAAVEEAMEHVRPRKGRCASSSIRTCSPAPRCHNPGLRRTLPVKWIAGSAAVSWLVGEQLGGRRQLESSGDPQPWHPSCR